MLEAIRRGRVFTAVDAIASPAALDFGATDGPATAVARRRAAGQWSRVRFLARAAMPAGASLVLLRDGAVVRESPRTPWSTRRGRRAATGSRSGSTGRRERRRSRGSSAALSSGLRHRAAKRRAARHRRLAESDLGRGLAPRKRRGNDCGIFHVGPGVVLTYRLGTNPSPYAALVADLPSGQALLRDRLQGTRVEADAHLHAAPLLGGRGDPVEEACLSRCPRFDSRLTGLRLPGRRQARDDAGDDPRQLDSFRHRHDEREARRRGQFHHSGGRAEAVTRGQTCYVRTRSLTQPFQVFTVRNMKPEAPRTMMLGDQAASHGVRRPLLPSATNRLVTIQ